VKRSEALSALSSTDLAVRLDAARSLAQNAREADVPRLQQALTSEKVVWVRTALRQAIARASEDSQPTSGDHETEEVVPPEVFDQIRTIAVNETTRRIVHEVAPIVGALRMYAREEISGFEKSKTQTQIERLQLLLHAIDRLSQAAVAPTLREFDLSALIKSLADAETTARKTKVDLAGPTPLLVVGDSSLVEIAAANGLRNAIEAVEEIGLKEAVPTPVVVNWGETDRDIWVVVLDKGSGPPNAIERAFEIGSTTKENHLGMGLATARQAVQSMSGTISLSLRAETGGARFEIRWPRTQVGGE
jgi:signal transduction histidine kinase